MNQRNTRVVLICFVIAALLIGAWLMRGRKSPTPPTANQIAKESHAADRTTSTSEPVPDRARVERPNAPSRSQTGVLSSTANPAPDEPGPRVFGRVVMRASEDVPVAGAQVLLSFSTGEISIRKTALSDEGGVFQFGGLLPGNGYQLSATKGNLYSAVRADEFQMFQVKPGGDAVGPITLRMVRSPLLTVRVVSEVTKAPLAGATIEFYLGESREEKTGPAGEAQLTLPPQLWNLQIWAEGHERLRKTVDLISGKDATVAVALKPGGSIHGVVTSETGEPVKDATVSARTALYFSAKSDAVGAYTIGGLPFSQELTVGAVKLPSSASHPPQMKKIRLTPEQPIQQLDFTLWTASPLESGLSLKGKVLDEDKKPIAYATVMYGELVKPGPDNYADSKGEFLITGINPKIRQKQLTVFGDGYRPKRVEVEAGPPDNPPEVTVVLHEGHWVDGRVVDPAKQPIPNVRLTPCMFDTAIPIRAISTGADGRFHFDSLAEGTTFEIRAIGYSEKWRQAIELDKKGVEVVLLETGIIAGNVLDEVTGQPVKNFVVKVTFSTIHEEGDETGFGISSERTTSGQSFNDDAGKFVLRDLNSNAALAVTVEAEGFVPRFIERVVAKPESEAKPIDVKLKKGGATIQGVLVDGDYKPVPNADVTVMAHKSKDRRLAYFDWPSIVRNPGMRSSDYAYLKTVNSNAEGIFLFEEVPEEQPIDIVVMSEGFANKRVENIESLGEEERLKVVINLQRAARIHGKVNRERFPKAAWVELSPQSVPGRLGESILRNSDDTDYKFERVPPGKLLLLLQGRGPDAPSGGFSVDTLFNQAVELDEGQDLEINLEGTAGYEVSGVVKITGCPLSEGMVEIHRDFERRRISRGALTNSEGRFTIDSVEPATYEFVVAAPDPKNSNQATAIYRSPYKMRLEVGEADIDREFLFEKLANVHGRILNPPARLNLSLGPKIPQPGGSSFRSGMMEPSGAFLIEGVAPGEYRLSSYSSSGGSRLVRDSVVMPGGGADLDLGDISLE